MLRLMALPGELLFITAHLALDAAFFAFFTLSYPIFLLAAVAGGMIRFARRLCR